LKEISFDYGQLAKEILEQMPGSLTTISLQAFLDEYISFVERNRAPKTSEGVRLVCKKLLTYFSPARKIDTIQLKEAEQFLDSEKKLASLGVYVYLRTVKSMFSKARKWNYIRDNPFAEIKLPRIQKVKQDYINIEEVKFIVENAETKLVKDVILTSFNTGMRIGEIVQLRLSDVDLENRIITVGNENFTTKSKRIRYIPLTDTMVELLIKRKQVSKHNQKYIFSKSSGMPYTTDYFSKKFKSALRKTSLDTDYCFHSLRHGFASRLAQQGVPIINISKLLGHSNIITTMIYSQVNLDDLRRGIEKLN